uniref:Endonuclease n=1 Tax=Strigamia maritima TaxID=126957 RepID=T1ILJ6_STRMM
MSKDESKSATTGIKKLDKINYEKWKMNIQFLMEEYQQWGFHEGTETQPPVGSSDIVVANYNKRKAKARVFLCNSVVDRLKPSLLKLPTCKEVWDHLAKLFEPTSIARNAKLYENFYLIQRNENEKLETFINLIQQAADDLAAIKVTVDDGIKAYMLLNRVGKEFDQQIQNIYQWSDTDFTFDKVSASLQTENVRRRFAEESQSKLDEVAAMYSGSKSRKNQKTPEENVPASGDNSETPTKESDDKSWLTCNNCRGTGHYASNCPSLRVHRGGAPSRGQSRGRRPRRSRGQPPTANPAFNLMLLDVNYVKDFKRNLISMGRIDRANYHTHIYHGMMKVYFKNTRQCLMHAKREDNNLYRVLGEVITENQLVRENPADSKPTGRRVENYTVSVDMWHKRFGHMYARGLNELAKNAQVKGLDLDSTVKDFSCKLCNLAKPTRANYPKNNEKLVKEPLALVYMDLWGPCRVKYLRKASYLLFIVDDATRYAWVFPIPSKNAVFGVFKTFHARAERLSGFKLKAICTDRGGEFTTGEFEKYLRQYGIEIQRTNAYSPQMNGTAERINRTILDGVRAMLADTDLPQELWAELSVTLTYLKNYYPHARLKQEILYVNCQKRHLSLRHLRRPGCVAYVNIPKQKQDEKLNVRAWKGMVGYAFRTRGYRIWNPETNEVAETKHVKFQEDQEWKDWSKASDESVSNDKFYDAKDLLEDSEDEDNDLSLTPVKTPGPAAQRRDALPSVQLAAIHSPLQKL